MLEPLDYHDVNNEQNYHIFYQLLAAPVDVKQTFCQISAM